MSLGMIATLLYGVLAIVGGIVGYKKAQSKISLIAGVSSGILLLVAALGQAQGWEWALIFALVISVVLVLAFVGRYVKTRKFMPSGLMVILGMVAIAVMVYQIIGGFNTGLMV
ncbi:MULTISPECIES: TMEM14 family protein [Limnospira]|uniref:Small integral membrane protein n=1 Tax=Limnospira maxima CS-328 TaxID=513049 RepID=B5W2U2_LIMMA|nr:TMEM14 family protein [Limnospira maxima]AMW27379.1 hypothetical protein AP285_04620 [Arthrospira platensis YZ]MBD2670083.1 TMEM14 family protein [Arthrospira platensis FACHB-439]MDC0838813.1 TMEM14 family protein [Limnoraphis robusta]RAQ49073.1 hypothetical protein B9S53_00770 [Arthrospira sp. O9.13F]UWU48650.1 Uncharacterized membrane protein, UPF0136 family [Arthrospira platensis C1]